MTSPLHLFDAFGIELEYMLVRRDTLDVSPVVDEIFKAAGGAYISDHVNGPITWSNELVRHVMEVKVSEPVATFSGLTETFQNSIAEINRHADLLNSQLMPTAVHPWMDPGRETELWPHEYAEVYQTFHTVFNCRRHGWANLQSVHLNLPFHGDEEFARLHAAVRLVLPLLPALAASSPVVEGRITGMRDNRLDVYVNNSRLIPHITGEIIPEQVYSRDEYYEIIFKPMFSAIAPYDPEGILQDEFLNARGAIARFDRGAIEIRLLDVQECPAADIAIAGAVIHAVKKQVEEKHAGWDIQSAWTASRLRGLLLDHIRDAENTIVRDPEYLSMWGYAEKTCTAGDLWKHILRDHDAGQPELQNALATILGRGTLSSRMLSRLPDNPTRPQLQALYRKLADCLADGAMLI
ncbi:MAG TPA: glutamate-cysteine ligase family protein [Kiritimatiellia bacterium]|nr:glutamate-cysteine ligase family protein [Kiritimatiellia bacterium]